MESLLRKTVKLTDPQNDDEEAARFTVREDNGDRLLIELIGNLPIAPVELVRRADVELA